MREIYAGYQHAGIPGLWIGPLGSKKGYRKCGWVAWNMTEEALPRTDWTHDWWILMLMFNGY